MSENDNRSDNNGQAKGIEVFLRIRPSTNPSGFFSQDDIDGTQFIFQLPKHSYQIESGGSRQGRAAGGGGRSTTDENGNPIANNTRTRYGFKFNGILNDKSTQNDVFRTIGAPAVRNVLDGFNSTVFAYGQTGSGKTFTITGGPERYEDRGIIPRAISMLFNSLQKIKNVTYNCFVSYFELYNENGYDLLAHADKEDEHDRRNTEISKLDDLPKVTMLEDEDGNYHFRNLSVNQVSNEEEALNFLFIGDTNRAIGETQMNQSSSRSHCIFTIMVEMRKGGSDTVVRSKLNLVDLAGSERVHKTNSSGQTLKEAQYINSSLFFLEMVIVALHERTKKGKENIHIPYRNSMMTSVLRDSLGGNCKTMMIATISPEAKQTDESISTCHFAQRVALVKNNAFVNEELEPELVIKRLKAEVKRLREDIKFLKGENGEEDGLSEEQNIELGVIIKDFLFNNIDGSDLNIGDITLSKIKATFWHFKTIFDETNSLKYNDGTSNDSLPDSIIKGQSNQDENAIQSLKQTIRQRDDEIKLLVKMVKDSGQKIESKRITNGILVEVSSNDQATNSQEVVEIATEAIYKANEDHNVCGVEYCRDIEILNEPSAALAWFRERYPGSEIDKENKELLQSRFIQAKRAGETVKLARETIQHHKTLIEKVRRDVAIEGIDMIDAEVGCHPIESESREIIEHHKKLYQDAFQKLKELKGEIEHIKSLMEKHRTRLQKDFDKWYEQMFYEDRRSRKNNTRSSPSLKSLKGLDREGDIDDNVKHSLTANMDVAQTSFLKLPPSARLTGNKETDEDIIAFYRAKEALRARNKNREILS